MGGCAATDIDLILLCTSSPEDSFGGACLVRTVTLSLRRFCLIPHPIPQHPAPLESALQVQAALGATNAAAFDITAACSGFVLGLVSAVQVTRRRLSALCMRAVDLSQPASLCTLLNCSAGHSQSQYIRSGSMRNVLVIGADALSRYVDW